MWLLSSELIDSIKDRLHTAKVHMFHSSKILTAATATKVTLNGSKQPFCFLQCIVASNTEIRSPSRFQVLHTCSAFTIGSLHTMLYNAQIDGPHKIHITSARGAQSASLLSGVHATANYSSKSTKSTQCTSLLTTSIGLFL